MPDDFLIELNQAAVTGLALVDGVILSRYTLPSIYEIRPKYRSPKHEQWKDIFTIIQDGWGDCKDFVAWRLAELWAAGIQAQAESIIQRDGAIILFHSRIRRADNSVEDPSRELGMI
jgi:hypothetical protein